MNPIRPQGTDISALVDVVAFWYERNTARSIDRALARLRQQCVAAIDD